MSIVAVIDFETTGLSPDMGDRATEVAVVVIENERVVGGYQSLMNAGKRIPGYVESLTGITNAMISDAPPAGEVMHELATFVRDIPLVAHNACFDKKFLDAELRRIRKVRVQDMLCSMRVARRVYPSAPNHKLGTLIAHTRIPFKGKAHRALADAEMTAALWIKMQRDICSLHRLPSLSLDFMREIQSIPCNSLERHVAKYRSKFNISSKIKPIVTS